MFITFIVLVSVALLGSYFAAIVFIDVCSPRLMENHEVPIEQVQFTKVVLPYPAKK